MVDVATRMTLGAHARRGLPGPGPAAVAPGVLPAGGPSPRPGGSTGSAYLDDEPVATASAYVGDHHIDVEFISARPEVRGRGVGPGRTAAATVAATDSAGDADLQR